MTLRMMKETRIPEAREMSNQSIARYLTYFFALLLARKKVMRACAQFLSHSIGSEVGLF